MTKKDLQMIIELMGWESKISDLRRSVDKHEIILDSDEETDSIMETRVKALEARSQKAVVYTKIIVSIVTLLVSGVITLIASGQLGPIMKYFMG